MDGCNIPSLRGIFDNEKCELYCLIAFDDLVKFEYMSITTFTEFDSFGYIQNIGRLNFVPKLCISCTTSHELNPPRW